MSAGETLRASFIVDFDEKDLRPHDASIVVQAEKSPVKITIEGKESQKFPQYKLSPDVTIYPMKKHEVVYPDGFKDSSLPVIGESWAEQLRQSFQFATGHNHFSCKTSAISDTKISQEIYLQDDSEVIEVGVTIEYTDTSIIVEYSNLLNKDAPSQI